MFGVCEVVVVVVDAGRGLVVMVVGCIDVMIMVGVSACVCV